jgi:hypothetical protein
VSNEFTIIRVAPNLNPLNKSGEYKLIIYDNTGANKQTIKTN